MSGGIIIHNLLMAIPVLLFSIVVVCNEEKPYKSKPFRLRVKNGDYIVVETEWSAVINKWSREIEFVVGQHTIIR